MSTGQFPPNNDPPNQGYPGQFQAPGQFYPPYQYQRVPQRVRRGPLNWFRSQPIIVKIGLIVGAIVYITVVTTFISYVVSVAGYIPPPEPTPPTTLYIQPSPTTLPSPTPKPKPPTPTPIPTRQPVPAHIVRGITPDSSGIYYGDSSSAEETQTLYLVDPWFILWKCADTTGSVGFAVDDTQGNLIDLYGPYPCNTTIQKITIHHSGLLRIGSDPFAMDGPYYYGAAHP